MVLQILPSLAQLCSELTHLPPPTCSLSQPSHLPPAHSFARSACHTPLLWALTRFLAPGSSCDSSEPSKLLPWGWGSPRDGALEPTNTTARAYPLPCPALACSVEAPGWGWAREW